MNDVGRLADEMTAALIRADDAIGRRFAGVSAAVEFSHENARASFGRGKLKNEWCLFWETENLKEPIERAPMLVRMRCCGLLPELLKALREAQTDRSQALADATAAANLFAEHLEASSSVDLFDEDGWKRALAPEGK